MVFFFGIGQFIKMITEKQSLISLTKKQAKSLSRNSEKQIPQLYRSIGSLFAPFQQKSSQNQTFNDFISMGRKGANSQGTERYQFKDIQQIEFTIIGIKSLHQIEQSARMYAHAIFPQQKIDKKCKLKEKKMNKQKRTGQFENTSKLNLLAQSIQIIQKIMATFFQIPTSYNDTIKLSICEESGNIINENQMIEYNVTKGKHQNQFDVWSLFDLGLEIKHTNSTVKRKLGSQKKETENNNYSKGFQKEFAKENNPQQNINSSILLFLIEADLIQEGCQIDGRAIGNGVAFVIFKRHDFALQNLLFEEQPPCYTLPILIHQCLHTLGFDHCSAWQCLMNPITNGQYMLCPSCMRKMESEIAYKINLKTWANELLSVLKWVKQKQKVKFEEKKAIWFIHGLLYSKKQRKHIQAKKTLQKDNMNEMSMYEKLQILNDYFTTQKEIQSEI